MRFARVLPIVTLCVAACGPLRIGRPVGAAPGQGPAPVVGAAPPEESCFACISHPAIDAWERRLRAEPAWRETTRRSLRRGAPYLERMREILAEAGLPAALAFLPVIESGFEPRARGARDCRGLWQLQAATARRFGLAVNETRDDRLDPERATRAAAAYLRFLHRRYRDWPLVLAAYNVGEGRVDRALARQPGATAWDLVAGRGLPAASRRYISHFLAVVRVADDAAWSI